MVVERSSYACRMLRCGSSNSQWILPSILHYEYCYITHYYVTAVHWDSTGGSRNSRSFSRPMQFRRGTDSQFPDSRWIVGSFLFVAIRMDRVGSFIPLRGDGVRTTHLNGRIQRGIRIDRFLLEECRDQGPLVQRHRNASAAADICFVLLGQ